MVRSLLNISLEYKENRDVEVEDKDQETSVYDLKIMNIPVTVAFGLPNYKYLHYEMVYFSIYLLDDCYIDIQLGFMKSNHPNYKTL